MSMPQWVRRRQQPTSKLEDEKCSWEARCAMCRHHRSRVGSVLALLGLLASMSGSGCGRGGGEQSGAAGFRFRPTGASEDLLCTLRPVGEYTLPESITGRLSACDGLEPELPAYHIDIADDRRRALVLTSGARAEAPIRVGEAHVLRFSLAVLGRPAAALEVDVRVAARDTHASRRWRRMVRAGREWMDVAVDVSGLPKGQGRLVVDVAVPSKFPKVAQAATDALLAVAAPRLVVPVGSRPGAGPTNVIVYLIDTLRPDHMSVYGYARPTTPRLREAARDGVVFDRAYSTAAWTRPSTASLLTSLHSSYHGAHSMRSLRPDVITLAERFRRAGWSTWAFVTNGHVFGKSLNFEQGFDRFVAIRGVKRDNHARTEELNALLLPHLQDFADEPFFLYVHVVDPHSPYDPPEGYRGIFTDAAYAGPITPGDTLKRILRRRTLAAEDVTHIRALYDEDIRYQDAMFGQFLDGLEDLGMGHDTLMVVTGDHGEEFFEHGDWEHGTRLYEEQIRVPLLFWAPGVPRLAGLRVESAVQSLDIMPTLLTWYGIDGADIGHGRDLSTLLTGDGGGGEARSIYFEEIRQEKGRELFSIRDGSWKLIHQRAHNRDDYMLFDLATDPAEQNDRSESDPSRLAELKARLADYTGGLGRLAIAPQSGQPQELDEATREQLEALGYLDTGEPDAN